MANYLYTANHIAVSATRKEEEEAGIRNASSAHQDAEIASNEIGAEYRRGVYGDKEEYRRLNINHLAPIEAHEGHVQEVGLKRYPAEPHQSAPNGAVRTSHKEICRPQSLAKSCEHHRKGEVSEVTSEYQHHELVGEGLHTPYIYPPQEKRKDQANKTKCLHSLIYTPLIDSIGHAHREAEGIAKPVVSEADLPCHQYKKKGKSHEHKHSSSPAAHISEGEIEEDIEHHQLQEIPCHKQGTWDTHLPNNEIDLELRQRLGYVIKSKANKEEEDSEWVEKEERLS